MLREERKGERKRARCGAWSEMATADRGQTGVQEETARGWSWTDTWRMSGTDEAIWTESKRADGIKEKREARKQRQESRGMRQEDVPLEIVAELGVQTVGHALAPLTLLAILLGVEEPGGGWG
jgi:hypothetical protein